MFHDLNAIKQTAAETEKDVRVFNGNGLNYLPIDPCKKIYSVRLSNSKEPMMEFEMEVPLDPNLRRFTTITVPLWQLSTFEGKTILLRNTISNEGIFQENEKFFIHADWDNSKPRGK